MRVHRPDAGFSLSALMFFATALSILVAAAYPAYQMQAKREMEEELIFRGEEYARAIQKYQRRFGVYPATVDQLLSTNNIRFLRHKYDDPVTGKEFRLITINPDGSLNGSKTYMQNQNNQPLFGNTQLFGGQGPGQGQQPPGQGQGQSPPRGQQPGQQLGQQPGQQPGQQFQSVVPNRGGQQPNTFGAQPNNQLPQGQRGQTPGGFGGPNSGGGTPIGGGGIIGVASSSDKESLKIYNNRQKYEEWEFLAIFGQGQPGQRGVPQNPQQQNPLFNGQPGTQQPGLPGGQRQGNPFPNTPTNPVGTPGGNPFGGPGGVQQPPGQVQNPFGFGGQPQPLPGQRR